MACPFFLNVGPASLTTGVLRQWSLLKAGLKVPDKELASDVLITLDCPGSV